MWILYLFGNDSTNSIFLPSAREAAGSRELRNTGVPSYLRERLMCLCVYMLECCTFYSSLQFSLNLRLTVLARSTPQRCVSPCLALPAAAEDSTFSRWKASVDHSEWSSTQLPVPSWLYQSTAVLPASLLSKAWSGSGQSGKH